MESETKEPKTRTRSRKAQEGAPGPLVIEKAKESAALSVEERTRAGFVAEVTEHMRSEEATVEAPTMLFNEPVYRQGLNITVRRGDKWAGFKGFVVGRKYEKGHGDLLFVVDTLVLDRFEDLNHDPVANPFLQLEHDPACRSFFGLVKAMQSAYPGDHVANVSKFTRNDQVTVVFFTVSDFAQQQ